MSGRKRRTRGSKGSSNSKSTDSFRQSEPRVEGGTPQHDIPALAEHPPTPGGNPSPPLSVLAGCDFASEAIIADLSHEGISTPPRTSPRLSGDPSAEDVITPIMKTPTENTEAVFGASRHSKRNASSPDIDLVETIGNQYPEPPGSRIRNRRRRNRRVSEGQSRLEAARVLWFNSLCEPDTLLGIPTRVLVVFKYTEGHYLLGS